MNKLIVLVFTVIIAQHYVIGKDVQVQAEHDVITEATTTTTSKTTTTVPTTKPTTTTPSTTTSATTTTATTTTTTKPTTTSIPTTTKATPTTPPPLPPAPTDPTEGTWDLKPNDSNISCIVVQFAMQLQIPYMHKSNKLVNATINVPSNANVSGDCSSQNNNDIILQWSYPDNKTDKLLMHFVHNETEQKYRLNEMKFTIQVDSTNFPGAEDTQNIVLTYDHEEYQTGINKSYKCEQKQTFNLTNPTTKQIGGVMIVSKLQLQAFGSSHDKSFDEAEDCAPVDTADIVPIAVGCALAALVIIVLIAYLIGRRRRQARGYLSMFTVTKNESDYIPMKNLSCFQ